MYCAYYEAEIVATRGWFISGIFRNEDNLVFSRALTHSLIEFFVPTGREKEFVDIMNVLVNEGSVLRYAKKNNRIEREHGGALLGEQE